MNSPTKTKKELLQELQEKNRLIAELEAVEGKRRQAREVLQQVREQVWQMRRADEIEQVLMAARDGLDILGIPYRWCGVNIVDESADPPTVRFHNLTNEGTWTNTEKESAVVRQFWRERVPAYRRNLDTEDLYQERSPTGTGSRSVLDVPFSHGTLAVSSPEPNAFSDEDIASLQVLVEVLSEGFRRLDDLAALERRNKELENELAEGKRREQVIRQQTEEILELSTPVMQVWEGVVVAPLIGMLDSQRTQRFMEVLLEHIVETNSRVALVDITGVPIIDTQTAQNLVETISAVRLLGAQVILTGVRPAIAQTLVHLGIDLAGIDTRASLAAGLRRALERMNISMVDQNLKY